MVERMLCMYEAPGSIPGISMGYFGVIMSMNMKMFTHTGWHENASAGNRTRVYCLEGSFAHHYTTKSLQYTEVTTKKYFFLFCRKEEKVLQARFEPERREYRTIG